MKVLDGGTWKPATPKGVLDGGTWKTPKAVHVLTGGAWVPVWPDAVDAPPYLYGIEQVNQPGRVVNFTAKKGFVDTTGDEAFMFRCSTISGLDGYVARNFTKTFPSGTAYTKFDCTLEDLYGDGIPANNAEMMKTISFTVTPTA